MLTKGLLDFVNRHLVYESKAYNKRFKRDSQRAAFLLCVGLCVYGVMRKLSRRVGCPLSGRYVAKDGRWNNMLNLLMFFLISNLTASAVVSCLRSLQVSLA